MNFSEMEIKGEIKDALVDMLFESPTPIQEQVIPLILQGNDIIAQAPTGTGKTCAFGIPAINNIDVTNESIQALILCPTRELVLQIENELKEVLKYSKNIRVLSIFGGQNIDRQLAGIRKKPQIIVGTTGRVMDHLRRKTLKLGFLKMLILDEVDEMLNMGFKEDIDTILQSMPKEGVQTVLFSATIPKEIAAISKKYQNNPITVKTQQEESDIPAINQFYVKVNEADKITALTSLIKENHYDLSLVFCNTKKRVEELNNCLLNMGFVSDALHGDLRQQQRDKAMKKFRSGETQVMIATDVAARGIDVDNIEAVFNFDIPHDEEYYVHRIGRTARAKRTGTAYSFANDKQMYLIKNLERYTKSVILRAEYSVNKETTIDKARFDKTLKLIRKADLSMYKDFVEMQLQKIRGEIDEVDMVDIAAALLLQVNENETNTVSLTPQAERGSKQSQRNDSRGGGRSDSRSESGDGVKFFLNVGTKDSLDESLLRQLVIASTTIKSEDIEKVNCLEMFSFVKVKKEAKAEMESMDGQKYNKRVMAVEIASDKDKDKNSYRNNDGFKKSNGKGASRDKKPFENFYKDKPAKKEKESNFSGDISYDDFKPKKPFNKENNNDKGGKPYVKKPSSSSSKMKEKTKTYDYKGKGKQKKI